MVRLIKLCGKLLLAVLVLVIAFLLAALIWQRLYMPSDLPQVDNRTPLLLENATIVDTEFGNLKAAQQILIADGKIQTIKPAGTAQEPGYRVIDLKGAFVLPGLVDMHTHIYDRKDLVVSLAYGVTEVRNMRGMRMHLRWREELQNGQWLGASLRTSSPILDNPANAHFMQQKVNNPENAQALVRRFKADGYDLLKVYTHLNVDSYQAIVEQAERSDMPIAKHGPYAPVSLQRGSLNPEDIAGLESVEHVEEILQTVMSFEYDEAVLSEYLDKLARSGVHLTPTLATYEHLVSLSSGKQDYVDQLPIERFSPFFRSLNETFTIPRWLAADERQIAWNEKSLGYLLAITKMAEQKNIELLVGSDQGTMYMTAGLSLHDEMRLMQQAGVSPGKVLRAATVNPALVTGNWNSQGSVDVSKKADLVISLENPLHDVEVLATPYAVVKTGQWLGQEDLQLLLQSGAKPASWFTGFGALLEDMISRAF